MVKSKKTEFKVVKVFGPGGAAGSAKDKALLGGKGANLAEMANLGLPVPPGFTIPTSHCIDYQKDGKKTMTAIWPEVVAGMHWLTEQFGYMPLVSVRSGAPVSMPGMMDTILNVGLTTDTLPVWKEKLGERATLDSYRRLIQMLGETAFGVPKKVFDAHLEDVKEAAGVKLDKDLSVDALWDLIERYKKAFQAVTQKPFPDSLWDQLHAAVTAVFGSWMNERAILYRKKNGIPDSMGTAVNVQSMVFGNLNDDSGSGVLFTRHPATGERKVFGEFLPNAQGEDVVAGIRTPLKLEEMQKPWPEVLAQLMSVVEGLEKHYRDMQDVEFTVQDKQLFILQCRSGKRTAPAAFRIAVDMVNEGMIDQATAVSRVTAEQFRVMKRPSVDPAFKTPPHVQGLPACGGIASGHAVFSAEDAVKVSADGLPVVLLAKETTPDDLAGMYAALAIVTQFGGATSHAAVVARSIDKTCVAGAEELHIKDNSAVLPGGKEIVPGTKVTVCGDTGRVWFGIDVPTVGGDNPYVAELLTWAIINAGAIPAGPELSALPKGQPVKVLAGDWFIDPTPMQGFLDAMKGRAPAQVVLDVSIEAKPDDMALWDVCGSWAADTYGFQQAVVKWLSANAGTLTGMTVLGYGPEDSAMLNDWGYATAAPIAGIKPKTLADVLLAKGPVEITEEFVSGVVGGQKAWKMLLGLLEKDGKAPKQPPKVTHIGAAPYTLLGA